MTRALHAYAFLGDFVLLYPVYALLFADAGLSTAEISTLFAIWSVTGFVLEIPSGVWADVVSRRALLAVAPLLSAVGFGLWTVAPSYPAFAAGFVLWGAAGALQSGALEALVYEELDRAGAASRYAEVIGRSTALGVVAATLAIGLAAPALALGGFALAGVLSVAACVAAAVAGAAFPEHRDPRPDGHDGLRACARVVRDGVAEVRGRPTVRRAVLLVAAVSAIWGVLDEYVPLLAEDVASTEAVPLLFMLVYVGVAAGGLLAARVVRLAPLLAFAAIALAAGALSGVAAGFVLLAVAFCAFQAATVVADARLQDAIDGTARSTVTSLASLATEVVVLAAFGAYGLGSAFVGDATLFAAFAAVYLLVAYGERRSTTQASPSRR